MTSAAFPFLNGRTTLDTPPVRVPHRQIRRHGAFAERMRRRFRHAQLASAQREHHRRNNTDAYLDRAGLSSVDWATLLTNHARR